MEEAANSSRMQPAAAKQYPYCTASRAQSTDSKATQTTTGDCDGRFDSQWTGSSKPFTTSNATTKTLAIDLSGRSTDHQ